MKANFKKAKSKYSVFYRNTTAGIKLYQIINTFPTAKGARDFISFQRQGASTGEWEIKEIILL